MDFRLPDDVRQLGDAAARRFARLGGVDLARRAEADPAVRREAADALRDLGTDDLDVRADEEQLLAGGALCRAAGAVALPWPLVGQLLRSGAHLLALVDERGLRVDHGDAAPSWIGADLDGRAWLLTDLATPTTGKLGPFVRTGVLGEQIEPIAADDRARYLVLQAWTVLGALEAVTADVVEHVRTRHQFGHALADFQVIRFSLADAAIAVRGLEQLTKLTSWRLGTGDARGNLADAIALRLHASEVATNVLRVGHQFYGALGFCDETDLSVIDRHLQPVLRYPLSAERMAQSLIPYVRDQSFTSAIA